MSEDHRDLQRPYVQAEQPIAVRVTLRDGSVRDGFVNGWRGRQVDVSYRTEMGNHVGWVPASDVERLEGASIELQAVREAALRFRAALEQGDLTAVTFEHFPLGACGDASELLGEYLKDCGLGLWDYRMGWRDDMSHGWLERDGVIVDVTADQFEDGQTPVVVTRDQSWHQRFEGGGRPRTAGLGHYTSGYEADPLRADYAKIRDRANTHRATGGLR